jgi:hypothetical protein
MAESQQVDAGLAGSAPYDDRVDPATVATIPAPSGDAGAPANATSAPVGPAPDPALAADGEPAASVRGVPTWTFAIASAPVPPAPPEPPDVAADAAAAGPVAAVPPAFPPPPPPPPSVPRAASTPALQLLSVPSLGPVGGRRHPAVVALLSVLTLGAYAVGWHARINREMSDFDARLEVSPRLSTFGVALAWVAGLLCSLAGAAAVVAHALKVGPVSLHLVAGPTLLGVTIPWAYLMLCGLLAVPYLVLLVPTAAVSLVMTLERVRLVQERVGVRPDRQLHPARRAGLLLVPVIGGLWHVASVQSCLNGVWQAAPSLPPPPGPRQR